MSGQNAIPTFVDGVLATMDNQHDNTGQARQGKRAMSEAQKAHILRVRNMVEASHDIRAYDWRNILFRKRDSWSSPQAITT